MLIGLDSAHRVTLINRKGCEVFGCEARDILEQNWFERAVAPEHRAFVAEHVQELLSRRSNAPHHCEYTVLNRAGERRLIAWRCVVVEGPGMASEVLCSGDDITDTRQTQIAIHVARERMMSMSRLATMGEMASGISHELNQPLAAIANYAQASLRLLGSGTPDRSDLAEAQKAIAAQALRAGEIIRRLRSVARTREDVREDADLNEIISELEPLTRADACARDSRVVMQLAERLPHVRVDRLQIQQVVLNLVGDAIDAATVQASVRDGGLGVEESLRLRGRLFTAFLTTKKNGTGLGLAVSRTIMESYRGRLDYRPNRPFGSASSITDAWIGSSIVYRILPHERWAEVEILCRWLYDATEL